MKTILHFYSLLSKYYGGVILVNKAVLTGNEAVSRGFWEAGGYLASSYPGSPTVDILESLKKYEDVDSEWATNEKVAFEIAMGASFAGARAMVSMKHVGINIAADPFMTFTETETNGGFLLVVGDDPGLSSSQNEQDSRFWGKFANIPVFDPSTPQEVKDYTVIALEISEKFNTPVLLRLTSRLCHCRGIVELNKRKDVKASGFQEDQKRYCMLPPYSNIQQYFMKERMERLEEYSNSFYFNSFEEKNSDTLIITSGMPYEVLKEINPEVSILKLAMIWPLPITRISELANRYKNVIVIEELMPFIEETLKANGINVQGKSCFPFTGEFTVESIKSGLVKAGVLEESIKENAETINAVPRSPMLCAGCPHRPIYHILKMAKATVMGDIGCYSLGLLEPFEVHKINISMGASLGSALGVAKIHRKLGIKKPIVAAIGDGTFFHSGMSGFVQLAQSQENITVIVLDNRTTAMTGGQITPSTGDYFKEENLYSVSIPKVLRSFGIEDIAVVDQFKYKETKEAILSAMKRDELSVIVTTRPCALNYGIKEPNYYVDENICISCRSCIKVNCPPISMKLYAGKSKKNSYINPDMCVGCSVCSQVCPVGAIKKSSDKND